MNRYNRIDFNTALNKINESDILVVDIRDKESFDRGHIEGALNLSNDNVENFISKTDK